MIKKKEQENLYPERIQYKINCNECYNFPESLKKQFFKVII